VDDEENILKALHRLLRREGYRLFSTSSPKEALKLARNELVAVVVSDQHMPTMSGTELLAEVKVIEPDIVRVILTGYANMDAALDAINHGEVFRFVSKPWNDDELRTTLRQAVFQHYLLKENKRLMEITQAQNEQLKELNVNLERKVLERTKQLHLKHEQLKAMHRRLQVNFRDTVRVFVELTELYDPFLGGHAKRVAGLARQLGERLNISGVDLDLVEIAAYLHDIGLIGSPKEIYRQPFDSLTSAQQAFFRSHPEIAYTLLYKIEFLRQVAVVVRSHHERFDGQGFPDGLPNISIPVAARVIHVVSTYDHCLRRDGLDNGVAFKRLDRLAGTVLDPAIVHAFKATLHTMAVVTTEMPLKLGNLKVGMRLARDIKTASGRMLMSKDSELTEAHIERLKKFHFVDPIVEHIYIYEHA
jgi:putative nucleotidyltransferase with HDIG domain